MVRLMMLLLAMLMLQGCVLTKVVSVPMRVTGAAVSIFPGFGNTVHDAIDGAAAVVDEVPL